MLRRRHNDVLDFEITIPEQLLKQQQKTKDVFNIVLSADRRYLIAGRRDRYHEHHAGVCTGTYP